MAQNPGMVEAIAKQRKLAVEILAEVRKLNPGVQAKSFTASGWDETMKLKLNLAEIEVCLNPERGGPLTSRYATGKVHVAVRHNYVVSKRFRDKKTGHDLGAIAAEVVRLAESAGEMRARRVEREKQKTYTEATCAGMNAALGLEKFRNSVFAYEENGRIRIRTPFMDDPALALKVLEALLGIPGLVRDETDPKEPNNA